MRSSTSSSTVQAPSQFSSYADGNNTMSPNFKTGLAYCDPSRRASLTAPQLQLHDKVKRATLPVFLEKAGTGLNVTHFYSPEAQRSAGRPPPSFALRPDLYIDITAELYAGAKWDDFRFFRPAAPGSR